MEWFDVIARRVGRTAQKQSLFSLLNLQWRGTFWAEFCVFGGFKQRHILLKSVGNESQKTHYRSGKSLELPALARLTSYFPALRAVRLVLHIE